MNDQSALARLEATLKTSAEEVARTARIPSEDVSNQTYWDSYARTTLPYPLRALVSQFPGLEASFCN